MGKCLEIEPVLKKHMAIMDKYDPKKQIGLMVDEWGTWWDEEPGTVRGHLYQQNTLRDAFVASLTLDVFHKYTDRIKMTNIARLPMCSVYDFDKGRQDGSDTDLPCL